MMRFAQTCLLTLLAVVVAGCHRGPTEQEKQVMAQLTQSMKTQCVGRYLVDLPDSFNWLDPNITLYYGRDENFKTLDVNVLDDKATSESVVKEIAARATKISAETLDKFMSLVTSLKTLRKGTLTLGGMPAQEVLTTTKVDGKDAQFFVSETNSPDSSVVKHKLHFEFQHAGFDSRGEIFFVLTHAFVGRTLDQNMRVTYQKGELVVDAGP